MKKHLLRAVPDALIRIAVCMVLAFYVLLSGITYHTSESACGMILAGGAVYTVVCWLLEIHRGSLRELLLSGFVFLLLLVPAFFLLRLGMPLLLGMTFGDNEFLMTLFVFICFTTVTALLRCILYIVAFFTTGHYRFGY